MYQQTLRNLRPKFLLLQKSTAISTVTNILNISSFISGGRMKSTVKITPLMISISKMNDRLGMKVLLWLILDLLLQRIELIMALLQLMSCWNQKLGIIKNMHKLKGRFSVTKKKKKMSYFTELSHELMPKSPKDTSIRVSWTNTQGNECKRIIQPNRCFCTHSFEYHETPKTVGTAFCLSPGCKCKCFQYVPYYDLKCMCRHSYKEHDVTSKMCKMCKKCLGFVTNWNCKCGMKYELHETVFQLKKGVKPTKQVLNSERIGHKISELDEIQNKENQFKKSSIMFSHSMDAQTYQLSKYNFQLKQYHRNELRMQQHKRKQIQRINQKYSNINYEKQVQAQQQTEMMASGVRRPELARTVTPLQLIIRPHNYTNVKLEEFLEKEYRKHSIHDGRTD